MIIWEENDRKAWLAFLNTPSGAKGLAYLREHKVPSIRTSAEPHQMHLDLGTQKGFQEALKEVESLGRVPDLSKLKTADRPGIESTRRE